MQTPAFFDAIPSLRIRDPLAQFLGVSADGLIEYRYLDAVKLAGHSCPTVASAYWLTRRALIWLYESDMPERGAIRAEFRADRCDGVTGVIANVVALLIGGSENDGFKGLAGRFDRRNLLRFNAPIPLDLRFTRLDNGRQVDAAADIRHVAASPEMPRLMQRCLANQASEAEIQQFRDLWQARVRDLLLRHGDDPQVFLLRPVD